MEAVCTPIPYFSDPWLRVGTKEEGRVRVHEKLDAWLDEVEEMEEGGLEEIVGTIFGKRQELMGDIAEYIIKKRYSEELERETAICPRCGAKLRRKGMHERTVETMIGK
jgi:hypothetical protein